MGLRLDGAAIMDVATSFLWKLLSNLAISRGTLYSSAKKRGGKADHLHELTSMRLPIVAIVVSCFRVSGLVEMSIIYA